MPDKQFLAQQLNRALQILAGNLELGEAEAMEIADLFEPWAEGKTYPVGKMLKYGVNEDGETQLYRVVQEHVSQGDWSPEATPSLFQKVGFSDGGTPIWTQPLGATDAYAKGDTVFHNDATWVSDLDGNVWEPGVHGWTIKD